MDQNIESMKKIFGDREDIMDQIAVVNSLVPMKEEKDEYEEGAKKRYQKNSFGQAISELSNYFIYACNII